MLEFISHLRKRYQSVLNINPQNYRPIFEQLMLGEALFRKGKFIKDLPLQIAIIGPTQAGKSSLTNAFLQTKSAGVSPLAGYTVHSQGFYYDLELADCNNVAAYFLPFTQIENVDLHREQLNCYTLSQIQIPTPFLPSAILWDTPDFDSIDSTEYREGVLKTIALADIIILAVSKEKYADQTVWDTLKLIEPLRQPTLICINKLSEGSEEVILQSLKEKWRDYRQDNFPDVLPLLYQAQTKSPEIPVEQQQILFELAKKVQRQKHARREQKFVQTHWLEWTTPIRAEHKIYREWQSVVTKTIDNALKNYQRDYLNHPHHYETFKQAIAELLLLLEIPSVAKIMMTIRNPLKKLRRLLGKKSSDMAKNSNEINILTTVLNHTLTDIQHELLDKTTHSMWREIGEQLRQNRATLLQEFNQSAQNYHHHFQQYVELAAQGLYQKLEEQPLVLNALRATRITTDAAIVALTLYTGGIGLHDLAIAPAMLMLTNFLTESAIGSYMKKIESDLKTRQLEAATMQIFIPLSKRLCDLPNQIKTENSFAISPQQLADIETYFTEKPHGLRLL